jgi:peptide/nickel transport system permease protein
VTRLILSRVVQAAIVVSLVVSATFVLVRLAPGDPFAALLDHPEVPREVRTTLRAQYGLDEPMPVQFGRFVRSVARGDLGRSTTHRETVSRVLARVIPSTILLTGSALLLALVGGIALGAWQGWRPGSRSARLTHGLGVVTVAIPEFILALLMVLGFALTWPLFPTGRMRSAFAPSGLAGFGDLLHHLALPSLTLAIVLGAVIARHQRAAMLAVRDREFVRAARAKGASEPRIFLVHALRNALAPVLALSGVILPSLLSGAVLVETIFAWPGMGATAVEAVSARDYHLVVGCVLVSSVAVVAGTLVADLALLWADPRQRGRR